MIESIQARYSVKPKTSSIFIFKFSSPPRSRIRIATEFQALFPNPLLPLLPGRMPNSSTYMFPNIHLPAILETELTAGTGSCFQRPCTELPMLDNF